MSEYSGDENNYYDPTGQDPYRASRILSGSSGGEGGTDSWTDVPALLGTQGKAPVAFDFSQIAYSTNPNYEGTPTEYYDKNNQLIGYLANGNNIESTAGLNRFANDNSPLNKYSFIQQTDANGNLLYTGNESEGAFTTRDTGNPTGQQLSSLIKMNAPSPSIWQDPNFKMFLASAAAMAGGAALAPELAGAGAVAEAFPVTGGALIPATELGAMPIAGVSSLTAGMTPEMVTAFEAALPQTMSDIGGLSSAGLTGADLLKYGKMGLSGLSTLNSLGSALGGALGGGQGGQGQGGQGGTTNNTTAVNSNGPWNTFLKPQAIKQDVFAQKPITAGTENLAMLEPQLANQLAQSGTMPSNLGGQSQPSYFTYGSTPQNSPLAQNYQFKEPSMQYAAEGGQMKGYAMGGGVMNEHIPEFVTGATGHYVKGGGTGQSDSIPAMLADGEWVADAATVADLGDGSSDAGARLLDEFRKVIREHKRSAPDDKIPPKASPLQYMKEAMKRTGRSK